MVEWTSYEHPRLRIPVYSLYGEHREPTAEMLQGLDVLLVDLQDIGARYYTFIWTMYLCMRACEQNGVAVVVLDRPNPINGVTTEGPVLDLVYKSFVGLHSIPVRHGKTIGELAQQFRDEAFPKCRLWILPMKNWNRQIWFDQTGLPWVMPSPNMPTLDTTTVYPGMCLVEGTNLSEGRGTTHPFEFFGAPWLEPFKLAERLNAVGLPGVRFRPHYFLPKFQKHSGKVCGGVELHVTNRWAFEPYRTGLWCVKVARDMDTEKFDWRRETYEFVSDRLAIDLLAGSDRYRNLVERGANVDDWLAEWEEPLRDFASQREEFLLYRATDPQWA